MSIQIPGVPEQPKIDDGGPAFPRPMVGSDQAGMVDCGAEGMSLRDYFAGLALAAAYQSWMTDCRDANASAAHMAQECYLLADAMLKARQS